MQTIAVDRRRIIVLGVIGVLVAASGGAYLWLRTTSEVRDTGTTCAEVAVTGSPPEQVNAARAGICASIDRMITAWNAADATAYGAQFTENATYVTWVGTVYQGRKDIEAGHAALFAGLLAGTELGGGRFVSMDFLAPDAARVVTRGDDDKVQTYLMVDDGGAWKAAAFHNTQRSPALERLQFLRDPESVPLRERR